SGAWTLTWMCRVRPGYRPGTTVTNRKRPLSSVNRWPRRRLPELSYWPSASACHTSRRARRTPWHDDVSTAPVTTSLVPLLTSAARSDFSGELRLKYGPSVSAEVSWVSAPQDGVGAREVDVPAVVPGAAAELRVDRPLLHAATTSATPAASTTRREGRAATSTV